VQNEFVGTFELPSGAWLFLAQPISVNNVGCLECHSTPDKAPPEMVRLYGATQGFGWHMEEIVGAQIVSMPKAVPMRMAERTFHAFAIWLAGAFAGIVLVANASIVIGTRVQS
jgi:protein-histidine pros-kinase